MGSNKEIQLLGCFGKHGSYSFFKAIKIAGRSYSISSHFPVRIWPDSTMLSIAEIQLLWTDRAETFCSLKLYFLPENTPEGRHQHHGEHEVIALQDKVIIRASDLISWLVDDSDWEWGYVTPPTVSSKSPSTTLSKAFLSEKFRKNDKDFIDFGEHDVLQRVMVLNYERYIRLRTVLKRLEGSTELNHWLSHPLVLALGGLNVGPNCRLLFAKEVFDYPELEAPKLKGKPKKRRRKRNPSLGSESNTESETSSNGSYDFFLPPEKAKKPVNGLVTKVKGDSDELAHRNLIENSIGTKASVKEEPRENSSIKKIANKLISAHRSMENGRMGRTVLRNSDASMQMPVMSSRYDSKDPESQNDMFGAALSELAQKLEKSNALQILPIRPSVIQKSDSLHEEEEHVSRKRLKTDSSVNLNNVDLNSFRTPHADLDFFSRAWNGYQNIYGPPPLLRQSSSKSSKAASKLDRESPPMKMNHIPKTDRPVLSITPLDMDGKKTNSTIPVIRLNSPSPFVPTTKIYGDPTDVRKQGLSRSRDQSSSGISADILDFSFKRRRLMNSEQPPPSTHSAKSCTIPSESEYLLDLSAKSSVQGQNKNIFHNLADIPPPNAMNQLGLRLTSEVTLFPSNPALAGSAHKANKMGNSSSSSSLKSHHSNHHQNLSSSSSGSSKSKWEDRHAQGGNNNAYRSTTNLGSTSSAHSSSSGSKGHGHGMNDNNKKNHSLESLAAAYGVHKLPAGLTTPPQRTSSSSSSSSSSKLYKSDHQQFSVPKERLPGNSHGLVSRTTSKEREKSRSDGSSLHHRSNHLGQMKPPPQLHPQFFPKIDPAYLHLFGAPMFMPQAHAGLLGIPPGAVEQLQMYLQQGMAPQLSTWPFETTKTDRGPK